MQERATGEDLLQNDDKLSCGSLGSSRHQSKSWKMLVSASSSLGSRFSAFSALVSKGFFSLSAARQADHSFMSFDPASLLMQLLVGPPPPHPHPPTHTHTSRLEHFLARSCQRLVFEFHFAFGAPFFIFTCSDPAPGICGERQPTAQRSASFVLHIIAVLS